MAEFELDGNIFKHQEEFIQTGGRCATPPASEYKVHCMKECLIRFRQANGRFRRRTGVISINVQFIHLTNGDEGIVTAQQREDQVKVMNEDFAPHQIQFTFDEATTKFENNTAWFRMDHMSLAERQAKSALQIAPETNLNFYTAGFPTTSTLLGWATFPDDLAGDRVRDGVVLLHSTLPGGASAPYNLGKTATHEVGHWLGLFHTFQGGCNGVGDQVSDTVAHATANLGTPDPTQQNNACDPDEDAPVKNFMNYTDDEWMDHFSIEQGGRMREMTGTFRPDLLSGADGDLREFNQIKIE